MIYSENKDMINSIRTINFLLRKRQGAFNDHNFRNADADRGCLHNVLNNLIVAGDYKCMTRSLATAYKKSARCTHFVSSYRYS